MDKLFGEEKTRSVLEIQSSRCHGRLDDIQVRWGSGDRQGDSGVTPGRPGNEVDEAT